MITKIFSFLFSEWRKSRLARMEHKLECRIKETRMLAAECASQREYYRNSDYLHNGSETIKDKIPLTRE